MRRSIVSFFLYFSNGVRTRYPVSQLYKIHYHLPSINRMVFLFSFCKGYPYGIHTITMERKPYGFEIQFYYCHIAFNRRIDFSMDEKIHDFNTLVDLLYANEYLRNTLIPYTAYPFLKTLDPL